MLLLLVMARSFRSTCRNQINLEFEMMFHVFPGKAFFTFYFDFGFDFGFVFDFVLCFLLIFSNLFVFSFLKFRSFRCSHKL